MILKNITAQRLYNQQVSKTDHTNVKNLVSEMGALQAQDYNMVKWAVGVRLPGSSVNSFNAAIDNAEIIRTHLLRPTWHIVSSDDIYWMLELTAPHIKAAMKFRDRQLELTEDVCKKCNKIIVKALQDGISLTRDELVSLFEAFKIPTGDNRAYHILLNAELDGLICSGKSEGNKQTYAFLEARVPNKKTLSKEESLAALANKYFSSRGPATLQDFIWWSGLSAVNAKLALDSIRSEYYSESFENRTYWFKNSLPIPTDKTNNVYLLPAYDEYIIGYKDRSACLLSENHKRTISINGVFKPTVIVNGQVCGIWSQTTKKDKRVITIELFNNTQKVIKNLIEEQVSNYSKFLNLKTEVMYRQHNS